MKVHYVDVLILLLALLGVIIVTVLEFEYSNNVIFSSVLYLSCLVNKEWTMYCC